MAKRANDKIVSEEISKIKTDIEHINDPNEELVNAEVEKFLLLFEKTFREHHQNILKEENTEKKDNLDYEDRIVGNILTKIGKKSQKNYSFRRKQQNSKCDNNIPKNN